MWGIVNIYFEAGFVATAGQHARIINPYRLRFGDRFGNQFSARSLTVVVIPLVATQMQPGNGRQSKQVTGRHFIRRIQFGCFVNGHLEADFIGTIGRGSGFVVNPNGSTFSNRTGNRLSTRSLRVIVKCFVTTKIYS